MVTAEEVRLARVSESVWGRMDRPNTLMDNPPKQELPLACFLYDYSFSHSIIITKSR